MKEDKKTNNKKKTDYVTKKDLNDFRKDLLKEIKELFKDEVSRINFPRKSHGGLLFFLILIVVLVCGYFIYPSKYKSFYHNVKERFEPKTKVVEKVVKKPEKKSIELDDKKVTDLFKRVNACEDMIGENYYLKNVTNENMPREMLLRCSLVNLNEDDFKETGIKDNKGQEIYKLDEAKLTEMTTKYFNKKEYDPFINDFRVKRDGPSISLTYNPLDAYFIVTKTKEENDLKIYFDKLENAKLNDDKSITLYVRYVVFNFEIDDKNKDDKNIKLRYEVYKDFDKEKLISAEKIIETTRGELLEKIKTDNYLPNGRLVEINFKLEGDNYIFNESKFINE